MLNVQTKRSIHFVTVPIVEVDVDGSIRVRDPAAISRGEQIHFEIADLETHRARRRFDEVRVAKRATPDSVRRAVPSKPLELPGRQAPRCLARIELEVRAEAVQ